MCFPGGSTADDGEKKDAAKDGGQSIQQTVRQELRRFFRSESSSSGAVSERTSLPEGSVVLSEKDAKVWKTYTDVGKTPAELQALLKDHDTVVQERDRLKAEVAERNRAAIVDEAAKLEGYPAGVLRALVKANNLTIEMRDVTVEKDGKREVKKAPHVVTGTGAESKATPLGDYIATVEPDWKVALTAKPSEEKKGVHFVTQTGDGTAAKTDTVDDFIKHRNERAAQRPNPLLKKTS